MKIAILNLNPGVDRVIYLPAPLAPGTMNRASRTVFCQGSKAANQAILLSTLGGADVHFYTFTGGPLGAACDAFTALPGITTHAIPTAAGVRVNTKVIDSDGTATELNERGGPVTPEELEQLISALRAGCGDVDILSIAGSIPQGVEKSVYKSILEANIAPRVILDCDGEQLTQAISACPYLIKPNRRELGGLCASLGLSGFSTDLTEFGDVVATCGLVRAKTGEKTNIICTLDAAGSVYVGEEGVWRVNAPTVPFRGFSGAGDTYLAAFTHARFAVGQDVPDALRFAAAAASAKVAIEGTNLPSRGEIEYLLDRVTIEKLS
ncbi:MAG: hypothetical protein IJX53_08075 [Clostridia bacterium]|nr:hypothetical protein [Clostridia bacterium]